MTAEQAAVDMTVPELCWLRRYLKAGGMHVFHLTWPEERLKNKGMIRQGTMLGWQVTVFGRATLDAAEKRWHARNREKTTEFASFD